MSNVLPCCFLIAAFLFQAPAASKPETPQDAIAAIIVLLEKDDLKTLFMERYGELDRFAKTAEEKEKIVGEIVKKFESKKAMLLEGFKKAKTIQPELAEKNGQQVAIFKIEKGQMVLVLKDGKWKFHL